MDSICLANWLGDICTGDGNRLGRDTVCGAEEDGKSHGSVCQGMKYI